MESYIPNFRGHRALILHPNDADSELLVRQLTRLGVETEVIWPPPEAISKIYEVIFFCADRGPTSILDQSLIDGDIPLIAISGTEAPGRLEAMLSVNPSAMINKPLRNAGIFKALVFSYHINKYQKGINKNLVVLEEKIRLRSFVFKAILSIMKRYNLNDDDAYFALRSASMSKNIRIEAFALTLISDPNQNMKLVDAEISNNSNRNLTTPQFSENYCKG